MQREGQILENPVAPDDENRRNRDKGNHVEETTHPLKKLPLSNLLFLFNHNGETLTDREGEVNVEGFPSIRLFRLQETLNASSCANNFPEFVDFSGESGYLSLPLRRCSSGG